MSVGYRTLKISLLSDQDYSILTGSETDSEDCNQDVKSFASEISAEEETYVTAILRNEHYELELNLNEARENDLNNVAALLQEHGDPESKEGDDIHSSQSTVGTEAVRSLRERLTRLDKEAQRIIKDALRENSIVAMIHEDR